MSRKAELEHERWFVQHEKDCEERFVVGAKVYRRNFDSVEEGALRRVARCVIRGGSAEEHESGDHPLYIAQFGSDWVEQTYAWKFFWDEADANTDLIKELRMRIYTHRQYIKKLEERITLLEAKP